MASEARARPQWRLAWRTLRNPLSLAGLVIAAALVAVAVIAPLVAPYDPLRTNIPHRLDAPSGAHPFGTDQLGRDILSRILYGARISLRIVLVTVAIAMTLGTPMGIVSGYYRGWADDLVMRLTESIELSRAVGCSGP